MAYLHPQFTPDNLAFNPFLLELGSYQPLSDAVNRAVFSGMILNFLAAARQNPRSVTEARVLGFCSLVLDNEMWPIIAEVLQLDP